MNNSLLNIVLFAPRIPQNTGQIARTCFAMGLALHLVRPLGFRVDSATLRRAGVGYWDELAPFIHEDGEALWRAIPDRDRAFLITKHGGRSYTDIAFRRGDWIILGNEDEGLPGEWLEAHAERTLVIEMKDPRARCLNLATAASAVIFEAVRQIDVG